MFLELIIIFTNIFNDFLFVIAQTALSLEVTWCILTLCIFNIKNNTDLSFPTDMHDNCDMTLFWGFLKMR